VRKNNFQFFVLISGLIFRKSGRFRIVLFRFCQNNADSASFFPLGYGHVFCRISLQKLPDMIYFLVMSFSVKEYIQ